MNLKELKYIKEFFLINNSEQAGDEIFDVLKKIIPFEEGYIFYVPPVKLKYSYNAKAKTPQDIEGNCLRGDLIYRTVKFGEIILKGENFTEKDEELFDLCTSIISDVIKNIEILDIINLHSKSLAKINEKLRKAEEIKMNFLSHVSHELRTPLNSILGFTELVGLAGELNGKQSEYINDIKIAGLRLLEMVNEILDMSKIEAGSMTLNLREFETETAVYEVLNTLKPLILNKNLNLKTEIKNCTIKADYQKFQQILFNLLSNAIKYAKKEILIKLKQEDNIAVISVNDDGKGISEENYEKIFEKFEQIGESKNSSTGLGLTITKELVKMHNGEISVKSVPEETTFTVKIPINFPPSL